MILKRLLFELLVGIFGGGGGKDCKDEVVVLKCLLELCKLGLLVCDFGKVFKGERSFFILGVCSVFLLVFFFWIMFVLEEIFLGIFFGMVLGFDFKFCEFVGFWFICVFLVLC